MAGASSHCLGVSGTCAAKRAFDSWRGALPVQRRPYEHKLAPQSAFTEQLSTHALRATGALLAGTFSSRLRAGQKRRRRTQTRCNCGQRAAEYKSWAERQGIWVSPKLQILATTERGRGVLAREALSADEPLVRGPRAAGLFLDDRKAPPKATLRRYWERWPQLQMRMAALVLASSEAEPFDYYFSSLPTAEDITAPFLWPTTARSKLPSELRQAAERLADNYARASDYLREEGVSSSTGSFAVAMNAAYSRNFVVKPREAAIPQVLVMCLTSVLALAIVGTNAGPATALIILLFLAVLIVFSFLPSEEICMLPVADLFNHSSDVPIRLQLDSFTGEWTLRAGRDFSAGEEVVQSYDKDNNELLLRFGFVEEDNPRDSVKLATGQQMDRGGATADSVTVSNEMLHRTRSELTEIDCEDLAVYQASLLKSWQREKLRVVDEELRQREER